MDEEFNKPGLRPPGYDFADNSIPILVKCRKTGHSQNKPIFAHAIEDPKSAEIGKLFVPYSLLTGSIEDIMVCVTWDHREPWRNLGEPLSVANEQPLGPEFD